MPSRNSSSLVSTAQKSVFYSLLRVLARDRVGIGRDTGGATRRLRRGAEGALAILGAVQDEAGFRRLALLRGALIPDIMISPS